MKPRSLRSGDTIAIVSPASPILPSHLDFARHLLEREGILIKVGRHALESDGYLAGTDEQRAEDLMAAFDDPEVNGVLCSRGGYGCVRLFPYIDLDRMVARNKLFAGFSDVTTLHIAFNRRGMPTLHSPMALTLSFPREEYVYQSFLDGLKGQHAVPPNAPLAECVVPGVAEGIVEGGCLCLLTDSLGTDEAFDATGKIVLIEDVDESPHRVDAMLTHLIRAANLESAAGIVIGEMTRTDERVDEAIGGKPWRWIVRDRLQPLGVPFMMSFPFGHSSSMLTLPLGVRGRMDASAGRLDFLESICS